MVPHTAGIEAIDNLTVRVNFAMEDALVSSGNVSYSLSYITKTVYIRRVCLLILLLS
jgi:hypothetical protein